ncbi:MAG: recombinase family protein [Agarilytica sp.]
MKIGYARVSTDEQNLDLQLDELRLAGCDEVFLDKGVSGSVREREGLSEAIEAVGSGDTLVVWKLDRLGRSLGFLCTLIEDLGKKGAGFHSLTDGIDTSTSGGTLIFHVMGAMAQFERDLICERTKAGMKAAKKRGKHVGRPHVLSEGQLLHMTQLISKGMTQREIADLLGVSPNTVGRKIKAQKEQ